MLLLPDVHASTGHCRPGRQMSGAPGSTLKGPDGEKICEVTCTARWPPKSSPNCYKIKHAGPDGRTIGSPQSMLLATEPGPGERNVPPWRVPLGCASRPGGCTKHKKRKSYDGPSSTGRVCDHYVLHARYDHIGFCRLPAVVLMRSLS